MTIMDAQNLVPVGAKLVTKAAQRSVCEFVVMPVLSPLLSGQAKEHPGRDQKDFEADLDRRLPGTAWFRGVVVLFFEARNVYVRHGR